MIVDYDSLTWADFANMECSKCIPILPIGSVEQHGPHLPLATDDIILIHVLEQTKKIRNDSGGELPQFLAMPPILYGNSHEHLAFPGSISLSCRTIVMIIEDILECLVRYGFRKLVVFNSHGGNTSLIHAYSQEWEARFGIKVYLISLWSETFALAEDDSLFSSPASSDIHAGERETSLIQYYTPDAVRTERITGELSNDIQFASYYSGWLTHEISFENGTIGQPELANADKGEQWARLLAEKAATLLTEISAI